MKNMGMGCLMLEGRNLLIKVNRATLGPLITVSVSIGPKVFKALFTLVTSCVWYLPMI